MINFDHPPLWYCILMTAVLASLIKTVISGLDRHIDLPRSSRLIRVVGGGLWAMIILAGMIITVMKALR